MHEVLGKKFESLEQATQHAWRNIHERGTGNKILKFVDRELPNASGKNSDNLTWMLVPLSMHDSWTSRALSVVAKHLRNERLSEKARGNVRMALMYCASHSRNGLKNGGRIIRLVGEHYGNAEPELKHELEWSLAKVADHKKHKQKANALAERLGIKLLH